MTTQEMEAFLVEGIVCRLACLDGEGHPYVVPCWHQYADGGFYIVPRERSAWARYLRDDGRVSLCIDAPDSRRVLVKGTADVVEEPNVGGRWVAIAQQMCDRYMGPRGRDYLEQTLNEPRWLFFVRPQHMITWQGSWHKRYKHYEW